MTVKPVSMKQLRVPHAHWDTFLSPGIWGVITSTPLSTNFIKSAQLASEVSIVVHSLLLTPPKVLIWRLNDETEDSEKRRTRGAQLAKPIGKFWKLVIMKNRESDTRLREGEVLRTLVIAGIEVVIVHSFARRHLI